MTVIAIRQRGTLQWTAQNEQCDGPARRRPLGQHSELSQVSP